MAGNDGTEVGIEVEVVEVAARDGLQTDPASPDTATKIELLERVAAAGVRRVEAVSFAHPDRVPKMADAEAVMAGLSLPAAVRTIGLVLNRRGFERAVRAGVDEVNVVVMVTDTFSQRNQGMPTADAVATWLAVAEEARGHGLGTSVTLSAAFGCPYEGEVPVDRLLEVVEQVLAGGPDELALADTIGVAAPTDVVERFAAVARVVGDVRLRAHFHNTRNTGYANAVAALDAGVRVLDASLGGIGGCPFAPRATGNIATEDLCYLLERMGYRTGVSIPALIEVAEWMEQALAHPLPALVSKAGPFPG